MRSSRGLPEGDTSAAQLGKWGPVFNQGVDRMRRLVCEYYDGFSFGNFVRHYPELQGTVTDLLIGDLFTDRVDKVWRPMESLYPPDKAPIPSWHAGTPAEDAQKKPTSWCCRTGADHSAGSDLDFLLFHRFSTDSAERRKSRSKPVQKLTTTLIFTTKK